MRRNQNLQYILEDCLNPYAPIDEDERQNQLKPSDEKEFIMGHEVCNGKVILNYAGVTISQLGETKNFIQTRYVPHWRCSYCEMLFLDRKSVIAHQLDKKTHKTACPKLTTAGKIVTKVEELGIILEITMIPSEAIG